MSSKIKGIQPASIKWQVFKVNVLYEWLLLISWRQVNFLYALEKQRRRQTTASSREEVLPVNLNYYFSSKAASPPTVETIRYALPAINPVWQHAQLQRVCFVNSQWLTSPPQHWAQPGAVWAGASDTAAGTPCPHVGVVMTHGLCLVCHTRNQIGTGIFWQIKKKKKSTAFLSLAWSKTSHLWHQQATAGFIMLSSSFSSKFLATLSHVSWAWQSKSSFSRPHTLLGSLLYIYFHAIPSLQLPG